MPKKTFFNLPDEKKKRIIKSAINEFSKEHYKKVTIDNIVNGAGIPKGSFYQYFKNKDDLYKYIFNEIGNKKKLVLDQIKTTKKQLSFKEYLLEVFTESQRFDSSDEKMIALKDKFVNECSQELRKEVLKNEIPKSFKLLEDIIKKYIDKGELRADLNIKNAAYTITLSMVSLEYYEFSEGETIRDFITNTLDLIINGMK